MRRTKEPLESKFQSDLIKKINRILPECIVLKNDPNYLQGVCDLVVLGPNKYAVLECKRSAKAPKQPNQDYYVNKFKEWSYGSFVYPENEEEVLNELRETFRS